MINQAIVKHLGEAQFFSGIDEPHLERLADISKIVEFPAHSQVFEEHEYGQNVYVVISGRVALVICTPEVGCRTLMEVRPGELIGWSPLFEKRRLSDTARTLEDTTLVAMDGKKLLAYCREQPQFGFEFMHRAAHVMAERLGATRLQLLELSGHQLPDVAIESD